MSDQGNNSAASTRVFIDGQAGTTGLDMRERLLNLPRFELLEIEPAERKNNVRRRELIAAAARAVSGKPRPDRRSALRQQPGLLPARHHPCIGATDHRRLASRGRSTRCARTVRILRRRHSAHQPNQQPFR